MRTAFVWMGAKCQIASEVWKRFGDPSYYFEPFAGSLAVLLARPDSHRIKYEYVNDADCQITNFFRAAKFGDPNELAEWSDWPKSQLDLLARQKWLAEQRTRLHANLVRDPMWFDLKCAAWFAWGHSCVIGNGRKRIILGRTAGVLRKKQDLKVYFQAMQERLVHTIIDYADWTSMTKAVARMTDEGETAILLDPPYSANHREMNLYAVDSGDVAKFVRRWAVATADYKPKLKIALCGFAGEHRMPSDWECFAWKSRYSGPKERVWFSPACRC